MHEIDLTVCYEPRLSEWRVFRGERAYKIPEGVSVGDFMVMHAEDYHWEKCRDWESDHRSRMFMTQMLHIGIKYDGQIINGEFITQRWKAKGYGLVDFKDQTQWSDVMFIADWLRERVSEVEQEAMMRILTREAA
jgi:hypothetical protein